MLKEANRRVDISEWGSKGRFTLSEGINSVSFAGLGGRGGRG